MNNYHVVKVISEYDGYVYAVKKGMLQEMGLWRMIQVDAALQLRFDLYFATNTGIMSC